jgi:hypothetical protein
MASIWEWITSSTWLSPAADVLSLLSFVLTLFLLAVTGSIRKAISRRIRLPALRKSLNDVVKELRPSITGWTSDKNPVLEQLGRAQAKLDNIGDKLPWKLSRPFKKLSGRLGRKHKGLFSDELPLHQCSEQDIWNLFAELTQLIAKLEELEKDEAFR